MDAGGGGVVIIGAAGVAYWGLDTMLVLGAASGRAFIDALTGARIDAVAAELPVAQALERFPVALLVSDTKAS